MRPVSEIKQAYFDEENSHKADALAWVCGAGDAITDDEYMPANGTATYEEASECIRRLTGEKQAIPQFSLFGDNNWQNIDDMIAALAWAIGTTEKL